MIIKKVCVHLHELWDFNVCASLPDAVVIFQVNIVVHDGHSLL